MTESAIHITVPGLEKEGPYIVKRDHATLDSYLGWVKEPKGPGSKAGYVINRTIAVATEFPNVSQAVIAIMSFSDYWPDSPAKDFLIQPKNEHYAMYSVDIATIGDVRFDIDVTARNPEEAKELALVEAKSSSTADWRVTDFDAYAMTVEHIAEI